jgi:concanavalin A-like lectin/glucanase superfamily protein
MSYEAEVLARFPALYPRLDKTGTDSDGDTWPDISGNGLDPIQVYQNVPSHVARGWPSPIETDGGSRAFEGWTNASIEGSEFGTNGVSRLYVPNDPLIQPAGEFAVLGWVQVLANIPVAGDFAYQGKSGTCGILATAASGTRLGVYVFDSANSLYKAHDPTFLLTDHLGTWFFVAGIRVGNVLNLYINGQLRAQTSISSGLGTKITSDPYFIQAASSFYLHARHDEPAFFTHAITDDDVLEIYEAALNNLPLVGRADIRLFGVLKGNQEPPPQLFPFRHNWTSEIRETYSWLTEVLPAEQDYEQRVSLRSRPRRSLEYDVFAYDQNLRRRLQAFLFQNQGRKLYLPIWSDKTRLTADAAAGATTLNFVSTYLDFNDGGRLALYRDHNTFEIVEIDTVSTNSTTLIEPTTLDWTTKNCHVVPVARALLDQQLEIKRLTDVLEESIFNFAVLPEDVPLAPQRNSEYTPRYTYEGLEVFDPFVLGTHNYEEDMRVVVAIKSDDVDNETGTFARYNRDTTSRQTTSYSFFLSSRQKISQFFGWLWNMRGRVTPVWIPTLLKDFDVISTAGISPPTLTVSGHDYTDFYQTHAARRDLALVYKDQTMVFKRIEEATVSGSNDVLTVEPDGAITLANLATLSFLRLARLNEDTVDLVWHTDNLVEVTLNFSDLLLTP